ncbi:hypothetical protein ACLOJK_019324 [Asimina triloba]
MGIGQRCSAWSRMAATAWASTSCLLVGRCLAVDGLPGRWQLLVVAGRRCEMGLAGSVAEGGVGWTLSPVARDADGFFLGFGENGRWWPDAVRIYPWLEWKELDLAEEDAVGAHRRHRRQSWAMDRSWLQDRGALARFESALLIRWMGMLLAVGRKEAEYGDGAGCCRELTAGSHGCRPW